MCLQVGQSSVRRAYYPDIGLLAARRVDDVERICFRLYASDYVIPQPFPTDTANLRNVLMRTEHVRFCDASDLYVCHDLSENRSLEYQTSKECAIVRQGSVCPILALFS